MDSLIVICCSCMRQRVGPGKAENYADAPAGGYPADALFSHTYCPDCIKKHFGFDLDEANTCSPEDEA
jgi:hypothetical protein